jgi:lysozyme
MDIERLVKQLIQDEGDKQFAYQDQLGYWTIGIGRCIDKRRGKGLNQEERLYLLSHDINDWITELKINLLWFDSLDDIRQEILINMSHQLGIRGLLNFRNTLRYIENGEYEKASQAMLDSLWAKQTPERAKRLAKMMKEGKPWTF